jgi:methylenetetrahydrofolate reductase (NADPH)
MMDFMGRLFPVYKEGPLRGMLTSVFRTIDKSPAAARNLERVEFAMKSPMFGCQACGNCVLGMMEYVCPQTCPKGMRNGPCGGTLTLDGKCEVVDKPCIWIEAYNRAKSSHKLEDLKVYIPPPDRSLKGTSSWINYFLKRDTHPETPAPPHHSNSNGTPPPQSQPDREFVQIEANRK